MANKIVISGYYGFDNIGDEAVLYTIISTLRSEVPGVSITVLSNNPEKTEELYGVQSINRWDIKSVSRIIKNSDMLISGGGSLLQDTTSSKSIPYYLAIVKIAQLYKKKVVFYSQGIGPVNKGLGKYLIKRVTNKVDAIFVRDIASKELLQEIGVTKEIGVSIDPVLGISDEELDLTISSEEGSYDKGNETNTNARKKLGKAVGVYIRPWNNEDQNQKLIKEMKDGLIKLIQKGYSIYIVPMHYEQDLEISKALKAELELEEMLKMEDANNSKVVILDKPLSIKEVLDYTRSFDFVIGMRLHSLIMAAATFVPMIGLSYDPKVTSFLKQINVEYCIDIDKIQSEEFTSMLMNLESQLLKQEEKLKLSYINNRQRLKLPVEAIKNLLN